MPAWLTRNPCAQNLPKNPEFQLKHPVLCTCQNALIIKADGPEKTYHPYNDGCSCDSSCNISALRSSPTLYVFSIHLCYIVGNSKTLPKARKCPVFRIPQILTPAPWRCIQRPSMNLIMRSAICPKGGRRSAVPLIGFCRNTAFRCEKVKKPNSPWYAPMPDGPTPPKGRLSAA